MSGPTVHPWARAKLDPEADDGHEPNAYPDATMSALSTTFPTTYPSYRAHTKMLIPFVL
ncbi:MAG TPA: hypothetical protein VG223_06735 [Solirubrobacteraceae bacterium]|nr:hypothetical protein [Solirubrobacteraceae bacterium]